jgi:hypothetical protein
MSMLRDIHTPTYGPGLPYQAPLTHVVSLPAPILVGPTPSLHLPPQHVMCDPSDKLTWTEPMVFDTSGPGFALGGWGRFTGTNVS